MARPVALLVLVFATAARADPDPDRYVEADAALGVVAPGGYGLYGGVAVGVRAIEHGWARFAIAGGVAGFDDSAATFVQLRVGLEGRPCTARGTACAYLGLDLAPFYTHYYGESDFHALGAMAMIRAGLDVGGRHVRFVLGLEAGIGFYRAVHGTAFDSEAFDLAVTTGVAYRFR